MKIDILNIDKEIEEHGWKEVTSPNYFEAGTSDCDPNGLLSYEIFGYPGTNERKTNWGWIRLYATMMNPHVYTVLYRFKRKFCLDMKTASKMYYINKDGDIIETDTEDVTDENRWSKVGTGFAWLNDVWYMIKWNYPSTASETTKIRSRFLRSLSVEEVFIDKVLVMPAFYRDIDYAKQKRNEINTYYTKLLHLANMNRHIDVAIYSDLSQTDGLASKTSVTMMDTILEMYDNWVLKMGTSDGFINKHVAGKPTDFGARMVISPPNFNTEHYTMSDTDFTHTAVPLSMAINIFSPFIIHGITQFMRNITIKTNVFKYFDYGDTNKFKRIELDPNYMEDYSSEKILKRLTLYNNSKESRLDKVYVKTVDDKVVPIQYTMYMDGKKTVVEDVNNLDDADLNKNDYIIKDFTWCEFLYIIAEMYLKDKSIYNTRYPVADYNGMYCSKMNIIPSNKHIEAIVNGVSYPRYPVLETKDKYSIEHMFTDTIQMFSVYPSALGADFDGDQISVQSVFSEEANSDCDNYMKSLINILGVNGKIIRELPKVVEQGLYNITYKNKK